MSYSITIGEAEIVSNVEDLYCEWTAESKSLDEAPSFVGDEMTGNSNGRYPGYGQWATFVRTVGIEDVFFGDEGLMSQHPGCAHLTEEHLNRFKLALAKREKKDARPAGLDIRYHTYTGETIPDGEETHDYNKVRLIWLIFWTEWALKNCKHPVIANS